MHGSKTASTRALGALLTIALAGLGLGCAVPRAPGGVATSALVEADVEAGVMAVLDRYMDALNALDLDAHVATYHFPHYRHASGKIVVWSAPEEAIPLLRSAPGEARRAQLRRVLEPDWHRSEWTRREIVQAGPDKVHVVTRFDRLREDGSVIKSFDSLYVMTREKDSAGQRRWGIRGRSSFAP